MKKTLYMIFVAISLLLVLSGCSNSSETSTQKTEEELKDEIKAEMEEEAKIKEESKEEQDTNNNVLKKRKKLSNEQIEEIASDLVACFNMFNGNQTLSIDPDKAEEFGYFLVFIKGQQHIVDNYIPNLNSIVPSEKMEVKEGETMYGMGKIADGAYVEVVSEAIFGVNISPKEEYIWTPHDPAFVEGKLKEVKQDDGKYMATVEILDMGVDPFLTMEIHLALTSEGYTKIEYVSVKENKSDNISSQSADDKETNGAKSNPEFANKTNFPNSETVNGEEINYGDYFTVIIPMYQGIYSEVEEPPFPLKFKEYTLDEGETKVNFAVFGEFNLEGFTVVENMGDEGTFHPIEETIKDSMVTIYCNLPSDFSSVGVSGRIIIDGETHKVAFGLDDMREITDYKVLKYK